MGSKSAKLDIYWNLHMDCWSVLDRRQGRVVLHVHNLIAEDAKFIVRPAGRARVLATGKKNVHAFVRASSTILLDSPTYDSEAVRVRYDPYRFESFVSGDDSNFNSIEQSKIVFMNFDGKCYAKK